jgi:hypothetical protein
MSREDAWQQRNDLDHTQRQNASLTEQVDSLTQTLALSNHNLAEVRNILRRNFFKVYSVKPDEYIIVKFVNNKGVFLFVCLFQCLFVFF